MFETRNPASVDLENYWAGSTPYADRLLQELVCSKSLSCTDCALMSAIPGMIDSPQEMTATFQAYRVSERSLGLICQIPRARWKVVVAYESENSTDKRGTLRHNVISKFIALQKPLGAHYPADRACIADPAAKLVPKDRAYSSPV